MFSYSRNCLAKRILWNKYAMLWLSCHRTSLPIPKRPRNLQKASHHPQLPVSGILLNHSADHLVQHLVPYIHPLMSWFLWTLAPYNHFRLSLLQWPLWICLCDLLTSCSAQLNSWLHSLIPQSSGFGSTELIQASPSSSLLFRESRAIRDRAYHPEKRNKWTVRQANQ